MVYLSIYLCFDFFISVLEFPSFQSFVSLGRLTQFGSVQFSHSVVSDSLGPHESQHARPPCPSPTPGVHSDSHPSSKSCHSDISSSVIAFSSCPKSLQASESFPVSQPFDGSSQCTSPKHPVSCIKPRLAIHFLHDSIHVSMPFSQIIPPSPSPSESKSPF